MTKAIDKFHDRNNGGHIAAKAEDVRVKPLNRNREFLIVVIIDITVDNAGWPFSVFLLNRPGGMNGCANGTEFPSDGLTGAVFVLEN